MKFITKNSKIQSVVEISLAETDEGVEIIAEQYNGTIVTLMVLRNGRFKRFMGARLRSLKTDKNGKILEEEDIE